MTYHVESPQTALIITDHDHVRGSVNAPVTLIEYGDYQCPYCGMADDIVRRVEERFGDRLCFVFRNFPLVESHENAYDASLAAEAAGMQGKFWEMHDKLYANQKALDPTSLFEYARQIGLDLGQFERDVNGGTAASRVQHDMETGEEAGVQGTPTFFINGRLHRGDWDDDSLSQAISRELKGS